MASADLRLRFWGVRGTVATPAADKLRYGGNTACAAIELADDQYIVLDCGTGVRHLGTSVAAKRPGRPKRFDIFLSHYHLDHIEGLALFPPLYDPASTITFHGFPTGGRPVREILETLIAPPYFPVPLSGVPATVAYRDVDGSRVDVGGMLVDSMTLCHPDGSVAYRIDHEGHRVVFATDHEHGTEAVDRQLVEFCRGVDYLIYDATYMQAEYESLRKGWGHSTWYAAVQIARRAEVKSLVLFHHHPEHTDDQLDAMERVAREELPTAKVAREGMELAF
jgi:phosphoribosyl 1,2-cyclic phosphodiesterase